jgi:hypothetical protein
MTRSRLRPLVAALWTFVLGQVSGCSSPSGPPSSDCIVETVFSGDRQVPGSTQVIQSFTTPRTGWLQVTVDWPSPETIIRVVLTQSPCGPDQFRVNACNVLLDLFPPPKPVEASTYWLRAGTYDLLLANFSPVEETTSTRVILRSTGCPGPGQE